MAGRDWRPSGFVPLHHARLSGVQIFHRSALVWLHRASESLVVGEFVEQLKLQNVTLVMQDWRRTDRHGTCDSTDPSLFTASSWAVPGHGGPSAGEPRGQWSVIAGGPIGEFLQINFNAVVAASLQ